MKDCPLTRKQLQILTLVARGCTARESAQQLGIDPSTARSHLSDARKRMGGSGPLQIAQTCVRRGWIDAPELTAMDRDQLLADIERHLGRIAEVAQRDGLTLDHHRYLAAFDRHLKTRYWQDEELTDSRARMRVLLARIQPR